MDALPEGLRRIAGTGTDTLLKGRFRSQELGNITLCLDPQCPPFLLIRTADGRQFLFGTREGNIVGDVVVSLGR